MKKMVVAIVKNREGGKRKNKNKIMRKRKMPKQTFSFNLMQYRIRQFLFAIYLPTLCLHYLNQCNL